MFVFVYQDVTEVAPNGVEAVFKKAKLLASR